MDQGQTQPQEPEYWKLKCLLHSEKIKGFYIEGLETLEELEISLKIRCTKCSFSQINRKNAIQISISSLQILFKLQKLIKSSFENSIPNIANLITQISNQLKSKYARKVKFISFYSQLTDFNRNFLEAISFNQDSNAKSDDSQKKQELKKWMENPKNLENKLNLAINKKNLMIIIDTKHNLIQSLKVVIAFFNQIGLKISNPKFFPQILINNMTIFSEITSQLVKLKFLKTASEQTYVVKSILHLVKKENSIKQINEYVKKFILLLNSINFWSQKLKFQVSQQNLDDFCFNIQQTTAILKNPNLNQGKKYKPTKYSSEFLHINDGEFIYNNEYRANAFCEDKIDLERDENTMIGSQFFTRQIETQEKTYSGKMIEISRNLSSEKKIILKLRLNANEIDNIRICMIGSSSMQMFLEDKKDEFLGFYLKIIPDQEDNSHLFGFFQSSEKIKTAKKFQNLQNQQLMVLEDDFISLRLNQDRNRVICWNETQNALIWDHPIVRKTQQIFEGLEVQFSIYVRVVLYSTIPEIEICDQKEQI